MILRWYFDGNHSRYWKIKCLSMNLWVCISGVAHTLIIEKRQCDWGTLSKSLEKCYTLYIYNAVNKGSRPGRHSVAKNGNFYTPKIPQKCWNWLLNWAFCIIQWNFGQFLLFCFLGLSFAVFTGRKIQMQCSRSFLKYGTQVKVFWGSQD